MANGDFQTHFAFHGKDMGILLSNIVKYGITDGYFYGYSSESYNNSVKSIYCDKTYHESSIYFNGIHHGAREVFTSHVDDYDDDVDYFGDYGIFSDAF